MSNQKISRWKHVSFAGFVLLLSACATTQQAPLADGGFTGGAGENDLVTKATGFRFPARLGHFVRGGGHQYDAAGEDLSVKYQAGQLIVADVYEYPKRGKSLATEFADRKDEVKMVHPDARLLREGTVTIDHRGAKRSCRKAVFAINGGYRYSFPPPYQSDLLVFERGPRFIEYRFTYSARHRERSEEEIGKFLDALVWPAGGATPDR